MNARLIGKEQDAFRRNRGLADQHFALMRMSDKIKEKNKF